MMMREKDEEKVRTILHEARWLDYVKEGLVWTPEGKLKDLLQIAASKSVELPKTHQLNPVPIFLVKASIRPISRTNLHR